MFSRHIVFRGLGRAGVKLQTLILRYAGFAIAATVANLAAQRAVLYFGDSAAFYVAAIGAGTILGLVMKYLLDKRWIFNDLTTGLINHGRKFTLYAAMGLITTAIFWGTETVFWMIWRTHGMRELGAVVGLTAGYVIKYGLDRRYVFTDRHLSAAS